MRLEIRPAIHQQPVRGALLLCLLSLTLLPPARAALNPAFALTQYVHDTWDSSAGLPHNSVTSFAQSGDGYLWFGTEGGLVRFDGVRFAVFNKRVIPRLRSTEVMALLSAHDGRGCLMTSCFP